MTVPRWLRRSASTAATLTLAFLATTTTSSSSSSSSTNSNNNNDGNKKKRSNNNLVVSRLAPPSTPYALLDGSDVHYRLVELASTYPDLASLDTAQRRYGLPSVGAERDCRYDQYDLEGVRDHEHVGCQNLVLTIEDRLAHAASRGSGPALPEVLLSGALHGDERVGPTAVVETAALLLEAAACESAPRRSASAPASDAADLEEESRRWEEEVAVARQCREDLAARGVDAHARRWMARLVTTRRVVVLPAANALGFHRMRREEAGVDPNRDFPFDNVDPKDCMRSVAARTINEVFRDHLFQLAVTFHGGMEAVAYEWGAPSYQTAKSKRSASAPDHTSQKSISSTYSRLSGVSGDAGEGEKGLYPVGAMNDLVYPVRGGMEDWAYAGSWDTKKVMPCEPDTHGGYPASKTSYDSSTLRVFNALVETSNRKSPRDHLGNDQQIFPITAGTDSRSVGHVPRNVRLSLLAIDLVEPYASIHEVAGVVLPHDLLPSVPRMPRSCTATKVVRVPVASDNENRELTVRYTVGGALTVDETRVLYARWDDLDSFFNGVDQPTQGQLDRFFATLEDGTKKFAPRVRLTEKKSGVTRWHPDWRDEKSDDEEDEDGDDDDEYRRRNHGPRAPPGPVFSATVDVGHFKEGDKVAVIAYAVVDQDWGETVDGDDNNSNNNNSTRPFPPQTHVANARTNPAWRHELIDSDGNRRIVQGRTRWFSVPVTIQIGSSRSHRVDVSVRSPEDGRYAYDYNGWRPASPRTLYLVLMVGLTAGFLRARFEFWRLSREAYHNVGHDDDHHHHDGEYGRASYGDDLALDPRRAAEPGGMELREVRKLI